MYTSEVRKNDRDYQVGDKIVFMPVEDDNYNCYEGRQGLPTYEIIYVLTFGGLQQNYVALGIKEVADEMDK